MSTSRPDTVSPKLVQIAELARRAPEMVLTTLAHHIDLDWMEEAYRLTRKDGAVGVDGQTAEQYKQDLRANLQSLLDRFKSGRYRAPPVRRVHIPKGDGRKTRPIGIPTFEDKVLQRAVTMAMEAVYEEDFLDCSYGFRPGRSAHNALDSLWKGLMRMGGGWVLDVDIKGFFDNLGHAHLRSFLDRRVRDGVLRRVIGKWLNAGVMEDGQHYRPKSGTPQGGVISPLLANVYLHEVLDTWFETEVRPRLRGPCFMVRYADDFVIACANEHDARRVMEVLPQRFERFGLTLHPEKTRMVEFLSPSRRDDEDDGPRSRTFDLLGFTHYWGKSRRGYWVVKRKTAKDRFTRALRKIAQWCRDNRHQPMTWQHEKLSLKIRGHYAYYGIIGNAAALGRLRYEVVRIWRKWLDRRGDRKKRLTWTEANRLFARFSLPPARVVHSPIHRA